jgi:hypothetical protein
MNWKKQPMPPRTRTGNRRNFLKALGISTALSPFIPYLDRIAEASGSTFPKRLLLAFAPNGTIESRFWPSGSEQQFSFPKGTITESLAPFSASLIFPKNLTRQKPHGGGPHEGAMASLWTGSSLNMDASGLYQYAKGPSIDQIIAAKLPQVTPFQSLALSVAHDEQIGGDVDASTKYMTYEAANSPVIPDPDPYHVFSSLMLSGGPTPTVTPDALAAVRAQRKSVLDLVLNELNTLNTKIGAEDRDKVQGHIAGLRDIEKRLVAPAPTALASGAACAPPTLTPGYEKKLYDNDSFPALLKMQSDLMVAALACDSTRVASLQWSRTFSMLRHTWLDTSAPPHHTNSHLTTDDAVQWQYRMSYWYAQQLAYLLGKLAAVKEGNGTLLDNSLVVWGYDMNYGALHQLAPCVAVLAGKLGGTVNTGATGRLIDFQNKYDWTQLLVTICQAMGVTDVSTIGDLGVSGAIPGLLSS